MRSTNKHVGFVAAVALEVGFCMAPSFASAQARSSDQLTTAEADPFRWYSPTAADATLPLPAGPAPILTVTNLPLNQIPPPSIFVSAGFAGRGFFAGLPSGLGSEAYVRVSFGNMGLFGVELGAIFPDLRPKFSMVLTIPTVLRLASISDLVQIHLVLPGFRLGLAPLFPSRNSGLPVWLIAPELIPVGIRLSSCMRFYVEARVEGPGAWITIGPQTNFTIGMGGSINIGGGFGDGPLPPGPTGAYGSAGRLRNCGSWF